MDATEERPSIRRPLRADARQNRERLVQVAAQAFHDEGPEICLEEIARRAGVGVGTLYRHFPNRQALLQAVYSDQIDALLVETGALETAKSPGEAVEAWMRLILDHTLKQRGLKETLLSSGDSPVLAECRQRVRASGDAVIVRAQEAGEVRADVQSADLLHLIHGIVRVTPQTTEGLEQAHRLLSIMMAGVRAQARQ